MSTKPLVAVLAATTMLVGGAAYAADQAASQQAMTPPPGHKAVVKDFSKLSVDGVRAYQDLTLARLAIFDGRTAAAKKYVDDADKGFAKAKSDESVFTQAEATMRSHMSRSEKSGMKQSASTENADKTAANTKDGGAASSQSDVDKPVAWLPVDGNVTINEDFAMSPTKAKAVSEANKSLAKGDKKGAMDKLKLAEVDTAVTLAVVPLQQTIDDVDQAKTLIDSGKFYEGSQKLRAVQDATVYTVADMPAVPAKVKSDQSGEQKGPAATH